MREFFLEDRFPKEIDDELHVGYERVVRDTVETKKRILELGPEKYVPLLFYMY